MRLIDAENLMTVTDIREDGAEITYVPYSEIESAPTAYDVDKVVEQLEMRRMDALRRLNENKGTAFGYASEWVYNAWNDAIEIVKGGGVNGN